MHSIMSDALSPKFDVFEDADLEVESSLEKSDTLETNVQVSKLSAKNLFQKLVRLVEVKQETNISTNRRAESFIESFIYNDDLRPVESKRRVWDWKQFFSFIVSGALNVNTLETCVLGLQLGLTWYQTWIMSTLGFTFVGLFVVLSCRVGNFYHISFPIASRAAFGVYFSVWIVINRVVMAVIWFGVQTYIGSQTVQLMLKAIFGNDLETRINDTINSKNITTFQFMCFMIFWAVQLPALWFSPHSLRHLFVAKTLITPVATIAFLIWTIKKADGHVAVGSLTIDPPSKTLIGWAYVRALMTSLDNFSTLILNAPDFARFSKTKHSSIYSQLIFIPIVYSILGIIGILITSSAFHMYHVNYWNPLDILNRFLDHYNKGNRAGVFLIAASFALAQLGTNVASNSISAGTDMTALIPKFINIRRGSYICAAISIAICPWNLMATSSKFTTALSAYAVFLSSISGVIAADYFVVRKGYISIHHCYTNKLGTWYMYNRFGTNWRAVVAYLLGMVPNFPGFIGSVGPEVPQNAMKVFYLNYFIGWLVSFLIYCALCYYYPIDGTPKGVKMFQYAWYEKWVEVENFNEERRELELNGYSDEDLFVSSSVELHEKSDLESKL